MPPAVQFFNQTKNIMLAERGRIASSFWSRIRGLLDTKNFSEGDGLLISPCSGIHMLGMKYAIDCLFLDKTGRVVGLLEEIQPGCLSRIFWQAKECLELPAGTISRTGTTLGDVVIY